MSKLSAVMIERGSSIVSPTEDRCSMIKSRKDGQSTKKNFWERGKAGVKLDSLSVSVDSWCCHCYEAGREQFLPRVRGKLCACASSLKRTWFCQWVF